jgi:hypothetical protein
LKNPGGLQFERSTAPHVGAGNVRRRVRSGNDRGLLGEGDQEG